MKFKASITNLNIKGILKTKLYIFNKLQDLLNFIKDIKNQVIYITISEIKPECLQNTINSICKYNINKLCLDHQQILYLDTHNIKHLVIDYMFNIPRWNDYNLNNLTELTLKNCNRIYDLNIADNLPYLETLNLSNMSNLHTVTLPIFIKHVNICKTPKLMKILPIVATGLPNIRSLIINYNTNNISSSFTQLKQIPLDMPNIEVLSLGGNWVSDIKYQDEENMDNDMHIIDMPNDLSKLKKLTLFGFSYVIFPENGILPTNLKSLELYHVHSVTSLFNKPLNNLLILKTYYCDINILNADMPSLEVYDSYYLYFNETLQNQLKKLFNNNTLKVLKCNIQYQKSNVVDTNITYNINMPNCLILYLPMIVYNVTIDNIKNLEKINYIR